MNHTEHPERLSRARWQQVSEVFAVAVQVSGRERDTFLREACAGDEQLRTEVGGLLEANDAAGTFLEDLDANLASRLLKEGGVETPEDRHVGPYRIEREIGRGGMGVVYLARRDDGQFDQQVALKLIKRGMDSEAVLKRFVLERQILARLQHPNIARLHDGGITADGQPFFAMEYVEGVPLTRYCDEKRLKIGERLDLFRQVCKAVGYAHQNLVVHRDLKPSNMIVTQGRTVKLLDFGIAKLVDDDGTGIATITGIDGRPMTPQYASPEQLTGGDITTATDVYALGAVLYELLCGRRLHTHDRGSDPGHWPRFVQPSSAVARVPSDLSDEDATLSAERLAERRMTTVKRLRRGLTGDLDKITAKALSDEPGRRYRSAEALLNDVERYQRGLPVQAIGERTSYRLGKFIRRHVVGITATVLVGLSLAVGLGTAIWQAREKTVEAERAEQISAFLIDLFVATDPDQSGRSDLTARELLAAGVQRLDTALVGQPDLQAEILYTVGRAFMKMALYEESEDVHRKALAIRESLYGREDDLFARSLNGVATALRAQARWKEAAELLREVLEIRRVLHGDRDVEFALTLYDLAWIETFQEANYDEAERLNREAVEILRFQLGDEHQDVARGLSNLGWVMHDKGNYSESAEFYRQALAMWTRLVGERHRSTAKNMSGLAGSLAKLGRTDEAEDLLRRALTIRREMLGDAHPDVATNLNNLALVLYKKKDYDGAVSFYREACSIYRSRLGDTHAYHAVCMANLGSALGGAGRFEEADSLLMRAWALRKQQLGESHPDVGRVAFQIGELSARKGDNVGAATQYRRALETLESHLGARHPDVAETQAGLAKVLAEIGEYEESEQLYSMALDTRLEILGPDHPEIAPTREALAAVIQMRATK